jgi:hypothetical protein
MFAQSRTGLQPRTPSLATFGASALIGGIYFTEDWIGKNAIRYIPVIGAKYN